MADYEYIDEVKQNMVKLYDMLSEFKYLHASYIDMLNEDDKEFWGTKWKKSCEKVCS